MRALEAWLAASGIDSGALFRPINRHGQMQPGRLSGFAVALVVKRYAGKAGLDPAKYAGHSLRAGLATAAAIGGASERSIMNQTGHRSTAMVRRSIRVGNLFRENAASSLGCRAARASCKQRDSAAVRAVGAIDCNRTTTTNLLL